MALSRGELLDKITEYALKSPENLEALKSDPKGTIERQFGVELPGPAFSIKLVQDTEDCMHIALPHVSSGELADSDLDAVAGGTGTVRSILGGCQASGGIATQVNLLRDTSLKK